jgi:hypothetical protein
VLPGSVRALLPARDFLRPRNTCRCVKYYGDDERARRRAERRGPGADIAGECAVLRPERFAAPRPAAVVGAIFNRDAPALPESPHRGCKPLPQPPTSRWERFAIAMCQRCLQVPIAATSRSHGAEGHANGLGTSAAARSEQHMGGATERLQLVGLRRCLASFPAGCRAWLAQPGSRSGTDGDRSREGLFDLEARRSRRTCLALRERQTRSRAMSSFHVSA